MGRARDIEEIRKEEDILYRASRPQRQSTYIPPRRDWRYATGVYKHEDDIGVVGGQTIWDQLDEDQQTGIFGRERRRAKNDQNTESGIISIDDDNTSTVASSPAKSAASPAKSSRSKAKVDASSSSMRRHASRAELTTTFQRKPNPADREFEWEEVGLVVRLKIPSAKTAAVSDAAALSSAPQEHPESPRSTASGNTHLPERLSATGNLSMFKRKWVDETYPFDAQRLHTPLRKLNMKVEALSENYTWFPEAVPVDAILPPGMLMSAKEINAYYPHHFRWNGVSKRFFDNSYKGADVIEIQSWFRGVKQPPIPGRQLNEWTRAMYRRAQPDFTVTNWECKPDRKMRTEILEPGSRLQARGFTIPTFDDLLKGLQYLPSGLDARGVTQCLTWYLNFRDMFTHRLELNVLHMRSLVHALREPLRPFGSRNLDMIGLEEWKENNQYAKRTVEEEQVRYGITVGINKSPLRRPRLHIGVEDDSVRFDVPVPIRDVLLFPCVSILGLVGEVLKECEARARHRRRRLAAALEPEIKSEGPGMEGKLGDDADDERISDAEAVQRESHEDPVKRPNEDSDSSEHSSKRLRLDPIPVLDRPFSQYAVLGRHVVPKPD